MIVLRSLLTAKVEMYERIIDGLRDERKTVIIAFDQVNADLRERVADLQKRLDDANSRHFIALATATDQHHELAMHPPTGILTGPKLVSPMDAFGELTREAINLMSAGLSQTSRDAMITAALRYKSSHPMATDEDVAKVVNEGEQRV